MHLVQTRAEWSYVLRFQHQYVSYSNMLLRLSFFWSILSVSESIAVSVSLHIYLLAPSLLKCCEMSTMPLKIPAPRVKGIRLPQSSSWNNYLRVDAAFLTIDWKSELYISSLYCFMISDITTSLETWVWCGILKHPVHILFVECGPFSEVRDILCPESKSSLWSFWPLIALWSYFHKWAPARRHTGDMLHIHVNGFTLLQWATGGNNMPRNTAMHQQRQWRRWQIRLFNNAGSKIYFSNVLWRSKCIKAFW